MPPERVITAQRKISFAPLSQSTRSTPRRNVSSIQNYSNFERIDEIIQNPPKTPKSTAQNTQPQGDRDIEIEDGEEEEEEEEEDNSSTFGEEEEEEVQIEPLDIPTCQNLLSTITIKRYRKEKKFRKSRDETTWTQAYFDITIIDETWVNISKEGYPILVNHLWTCKFCGPTFTSTDKQCHDNTTVLNKHIHQAHEMNPQKHKLDIQPTLKSSIL